MRWNDNLSDFVQWCLDTDDESAFAEALATVPNDQWLRVETTLGLKLFDEPNAMPGMVPAAMPPHGGTPEDEFAADSVPRRKQVIFAAEQINRRSSIQV
jgi:hypothetical protein